MITIYKNYQETKQPHYITIDQALERIKNCNSQKQIDIVRGLAERHRNETDTELKKKIKLELSNEKGKLPCILFSGEFTKREDRCIVEHSGFICLDFDKLNEPERFRDDLKIYPFVYSAFLSPSGDGVKAIARIEPSIEKHKGYFKALFESFKGVDRSGINLSRICYESCDDKLWINKDAVLYTEYIDTEKPQKSNVQQKHTNKTDYSKLQIVAEMIRNSVDGEKHDTLLKASKLAGGYIASGQISELEAYRVIEYEISLKDIADIDGARKTIKDGIEHGKLSPIEVKEYENYKPVKSNVPVNIPKESLESFDFLAKKNEIDEYLKQWREGTFQMGLSTGIPNLDKHFRFKRGNFNVFNGFDNVGKSTTIWYFSLLSALYHNWKWLIYTSENKSGSVFKKLIEFYWGERIESMNDLKYRIAYNFISSHFKIIANDKMYNFKDILAMTEQVHLASKIDGVLVDPYNALKIDLSDNSKLNTHEYHYEAASEMQLFAKRMDICVYLNCHVVTSAMRMKTPPMKADTEGGGKFANKADDFITIHRETQDQEKWMETELHVRKVKEIETGGSYTPIDNPFVLIMQRGFCSFKDKSGYDPIWHYHSKGNVPQSFQMEEDVKASALQPNSEFNAEPISTPKQKEELFPDSPF